MIVGFYYKDIFIYQVICYIIEMSATGNGVNSNK